MNGPTCARCGQGPLVFDKRVGCYRVAGDSPADCETGHFPAWRHTPGPLTPKQERAVAKARAEGRTQL